MSNSARIVGAGLTLLLCAAPALAEPVTIDLFAVTSPVQPPSIGYPVRFTVFAHGGTAPLQYRFWRRDPGGWVMVQDYSTVDTYTWTPTSEDAGAHDIQVWVRSAGSTADYEAWARHEVLLSAPAPGLTAFEPDVTFPIPVNTPTAWTATATGVTTEFKFW